MRREAPAATMPESKLRTARVVSVIAATVISLACGTNVTTPPISVTACSSADETGTFGNLGMYIAGIPVGLLVDSKGPKPGALLGAVSIGAGYFAMHRAYNSGPGSVPMPWLCFFAFLTGIGGCAAFAGSVKTSAVNWPNHRGTATAFPLSGFGLGAFFFSMISSLAFPDNTSDLLLLLAVATFTMVFIGAFFLCIVPNSTTYFPVPDADERSGSDSTLLKRTKSGENRHGGGRLPHEPGMQPELNFLHEDIPKVSANVNESDAPNRGTEETSSLLSKSSGSAPGDIPYQSEDVKPPVDDDSHYVDIRGFALFSRMKFYQLWLLLGLLTGIGLMTINNIGNDARAIWHHYDDSATSEFIQERQLMHVEILSFMSFIGRLTSGVGSDIIVKKLGMSRFWCLFISSSIFLVAQISGTRIENPHLLGFLSGLTGLAYGFHFGVFPALVAETFGVRGLSQNWGCMTLSPIVFGNIFNLVYGYIYDGHSIILPDGQRDCREGLYCYQSAYWVTFGASLAGIALSLWSIRHDWAGKVRQQREKDRAREA